MQIEKLNITSGFGKGEANWLSLVYDSKSNCEQADGSEVMTRLGEVKKVYLATVYHL